MSRKKWHRYMTMAEAVRAVCRIYASYEAMPLDTKRVAFWVRTLKAQCEFSCDNLEAKVPQVLARLMEESEVEYRLGQWVPMPGKVDRLGNVVDEIALPRVWRGT